ncbi:MAG: FAD-dependent oxidoreductase [Actinobacteria bacterium]|nr:FAD-dependent oxidoreductase [Actinomycetota bacterium]
MQGSTDGKKRVVVVGAGTAGLSAGLHLGRLARRRKDIRVILVDENDIHLMSHLLRDYLTKKRGADEVSIPLETALDGTEIEFVRARVTGIDTGRQIVKTDQGQQGYDYLVLAPGSVADYGGAVGTREHAYTLKTMDDAEALREHVVELFKRAARESEDEECKSMLTFVIGGGGVAGVELAMSLSEWLDELRLSHWVPTEQIEVVLVEELEVVMPSYPRQVSEIAESVLREKGIRHLYGSPIVKVTPTHVHLSDGVRIPTKTVIWSGGVRANLLIKEAGLRVYADGRAVVNSHLQSNYSNIYVIGDAASFVDPRTGLRAPDVAQVARREGVTAVQNIYADIVGGISRTCRGGIFGYIVSLGERRPLVVIGERVFPEPLAKLVERVRDFMALYRLGGVKFLSRCLSRRRGEVSGSESQEEAA